MKKLLVIGSYYTELSIVLRARELGYYTIVVDYYTDAERTPAKAVADEAWDMSWTDFDALARRCKEAGVNGILAGYSENRVDSMIRLCEILGLPCGLTMEQFDITRDKKQFKHYCQLYGLEVVQEHQYGDIFDFPVIVKPVDRGGSIGITVAYSREQFEHSYEYAMSQSPAGQVVIEDFIGDGIKVDVYYYVKNQKITLLGMSDTIMCKGHEGAEILQKAWRFPSQFITQYLEETDGKVQAFLRGIHIDNQYLTISAFYRNGHFYFFEAGFRLSGEMSFNYYQQISGFDYLKEVIRYAVGDTDDALLPQYDCSQGSSIILNFFVKDGVIGRMSEAGDIMKLPGVCDILLYACEGTKVSNSTRLLKKVAMCTIFSENLAECVRMVNQSFEVKAQNGEDMIYERVTGNEL